VPIYFWLRNVLKLSFIRGRA